MSRSVHLEILTVFFHDMALVLEVNMNIQNKPNTFTLWPAQHMHNTQNSQLICSLSPNHGQAYILHYIGLVLVLK